MEIEYKKTNLLKAPIAEAGEHEGGGLLPRLLLVAPLTFHREAPDPALCNK